MRATWIISAIAAIGLAASASAQEVNQSTRQQVERIIAAYQDAENTENAAAVAELYTKDGVIVSPFGGPLVKSGPQEIQKYYEGGFRSMKNRHVEIKLDELSPLGTDAAIGVGNFQLTGQGQNGAIKLDGNWTAVYVNDESVWKLRLLTVFTPPPPPK
jgi:uncharacterized protein (TIGR02246 family)